MRRLCKNEELTETDVRRYVHIHKASRTLITLMHKYQAMYIRMHVRMYPQVNKYSGVQRNWCNLHTYQWLGQL